MRVRLEVETDVDKTTFEMLPEVLYSRKGASLELTHLDKALVIAGWRLPRSFQIRKVTKVGEPGGGTLTLNANDVQAIR